MYQDVLNFWFQELAPEMWWKKSAELDQTIKKRFLSLHQQAIKGELFAWRGTAKGALAEIVILDQFSRNIFRDTPDSFKHDAVALVLSQSAVEKGFHKELTEMERCFLLLPFMHSESKVIHAEALTLFSEFASKENLEFELKHKVIIDRFGRYPHRNRILGRESTAQETEFLKQPHSSF